METSVTLDLMCSMNEVKIFNCNNYDDKNVKESISKIIDSFDVLKNVKSGSKVVIKANLVSAMSPDRSVTTHPLLLKYLTDYLLSKDCSVVIGDSPSGLYNETSLNHIYKVTRMSDTGAKLNNNFKTVNTVYNDAKVLKSFEYTAYLDEADIKINFCKLKTHGMMKMSCSVKNLFGVIPGTLKPQYHYRFPNPIDFANMLIDINEFFKFDLNIVDAIEGMEGNGPTMGDSRHIGLILASSNPYILDYVCADIIGLDPMSVETIRQSSVRKLFDSNNVVTNIDYKKYIIKDYKHNTKLASLQFYSNSNNLFSKLVSVVARKVFNNRPECINKKCIGCQKCFNMCPAKAISMVNNKPVIDRSKCIKCYCCQEFCPKGAMVVKTSIVTRIFKRKH